VFFAKKDQASKDHALLQAVNKLLCKKITDELAKGANVHQKIGIKGDSLLHCVFHEFILPPQREELFTGEKGKRLGAVISLLTERGIKVDEKNVLGQTPLHAACKHAKVFDSEGWAATVLPPLLLRGADIHGVDVLGNAPLHYAIMNAQASTYNAISLLADEKNINLANIQGDTPLLLAVKGAGFLSIVLMLVQAGALVCIRDKDGKLPSDYATFNGNYKVATMLKELEAKEKARALPQPAAEPVPPHAVEEAQRWVMLKPDRIAQVSNDKAIGYNITSIFNFRAEHVTRIVHNCETRQDVVQVAPFAAHPDSAELTDAFAHYKKMGGALDWQPAEQDMRAKPFFLRGRGVK